MQHQPSHPNTQIITSSQIYIYKYVDESVSRGTCKIHFRCWISPINCISTEGPVSSHYCFHTKPATLQACQLPIKLFLPLHPVLSLGSDYVCVPLPSSVPLCQLLRYFPGTCLHVHQTLYFSLLPPSSIYSTHPILFLL